MHYCQWSTWYRVLPSGLRDRYRELRQLNPAYLLKSSLAEDLLNGLSHVTWSVAISDFCQRTHVQRLSYASAISRNQGLPKYCKQHKNFKHQSEVTRKGVFYANNSMKRKDCVRAPLEFLSIIYNIVNWGEWLWHTSHALSFCSIYSPRDPAYDKNIPVYIGQWSNEIVWVWSIKHYSHDQHHFINNHKQSILFYWNSFSWC